MTVRAHTTVPLARRQLLHEPLKLSLALIGVTVSVALVGLLFGLREGINRQVTTYEDHVGAAIYVAQPDTRNFISSGSSALPASIGRELRKVPGVAEAGPVTNTLGILALHDKRVASMLVGFEPNKIGGPWEMASGRPPVALDEIALDRVMADAHGLKVGDMVKIRDRHMRVVGLTDRTASWMTPLIFTTQRAANAIQRRGDTSTFYLVRARDRSESGAAALKGRLARRFPQLSVLSRGTIAASDRALMSQSFDAPLLTMALIALAVGALVIGITIYSFISERRREFGSLKAIGGRNGRLYRIVTSQALLIAAVGLAGGLLLERLASYLVHATWPKFLFVSLGSHYALMVAAALLMALIGALVPIRTLAKLDPLEVFRR